HRLGDVLQVLSTHVGKDEINLAADLPLRVIGNADAAGIRDTLKPRGDVDTVAKNIVVVDDDITDVNPDSEFDPDVLRDVRIARRHAALGLDRATHRVDRAGELHQYSIARCLD